VIVEAMVLALALAVPGGDEPGKGTFGPDVSALQDLARRVDQGLLAHIDEDEEAKARQQEDPKPQRPGPQEVQPRAGGVVDFEWLEIQPRVGMGLFSKEYHINASPAFGVELRAPVTLLSPSSNPTGDYLGLWLELTGIMGKRTLKPEVDKPSGLIMATTLGLDYTFYRDETWMLMARAGIQYVMYGGISDLKNGYGPMIGITAGAAITRSISLTVAPEFLMGKSDFIILGLVGLAIQF
jgi:hypothetical protein